MIHEIAHLSDLPADLPADTLVVVWLYSPQPDMEQFAVNHEADCRRVNDAFTAFAETPRRGVYYARCDYRRYNNSVDILCQMIMDGAIMALGPPAFILVRNGRIIERISYLRCAYGHLTPSLWEHLQPKTTVAGMRAALVQLIPRIRQPDVEVLRGNRVYRRVLRGILIPNMRG